MFTKNSDGVKVIAVNQFFYSYPESYQSVVCCGEYQDVLYCFRSNVKQGCAFCEFDPYSVCECAVCEK